MACDMIFFSCFWMSTSTPPVYPPPPLSNSFNAYVKIASKLTHIFACFLQQGNIRHAYNLTLQWLEMGRSLDFKDYHMRKINNFWYTVFVSLSFDYSINTLAFPNFDGKCIDKIIKKGLFWLSLRKHVAGILKIMYF